ncbi:MAG: sigma-54 dependent transcriptional regulator [Spirosomataceae bacterium]
MTPNELQSIKARFGIIGNAPALNHAIQVAVQVADTDMTVLISGESGSGKESFSKIIHALSYRKHSKFIAINCGAIPEGTIDSELFGHEKGSFTGAIGERKGYFEEVNGGTIFLDEIGEMPLGTQARLLRVLETGEFIRVGSSKVQKTNVRVVAATNRNLLDAVTNGKFREDLYYRLNTVPINVPPLRERGQDIELLFRKFSADFSERYRIKPIELTDDAKNLLTSYRFPGNIRQLKNIAEQVSILEVDNRVVDGRILARYLPEEERGRVPGLFREPDSSSAQSINERDLLYRVLFDLKRDVTEMKKLFLEMLQNGGNGGEILKEHADLFRNVEADSILNFPEQNGAKLLPPTIEPSVIHIDNPSSIRTDVVDVTHETEEEDSYSLDKQEKEMILKALRKTNNKRKYAAQALGISERTLYRKIKQYGIEEE